MSWLEAKYIPMVGAQLSLFKMLRPSLWNFRCPYCGDSEKDATLCRGYIYFDHEKGCYKYKCHNCGAGEKFIWFLKENNQTLYQDYKLECIKETGMSKKRPEKSERVKHKRRRLSSKKEDVVEKTQIPKKLSEFERVSDLKSSHIAVKYVKSRCIPKSSWKDLWFAEDMKHVADVVGGYDDTYFDSSPRLLLPFITQDGVMSHIQGRGIGDRVKKSSRYYTLECEIGYPKVFGLNRVNFKKRAYVVEGPIDSLFLDNYLGMGGSDIPWELFDKNSTTFIFDNEPRSPIITKKMNQVIKLGYSVCIWGKNIQYKDINDIIMKGGKSPEWLQEYIDSHTYRGSKAKLKISQYAIRR